MEPATLKPSKPRMRETINQEFLATASPFESEEKQAEVLKAVAEKGLGLAKRGNASRAANFAMARMKLEGVPVAKIAERTGLSVEAVKRRLRWVEAQAKNGKAE